jgi:hypothetical protein
VRGAGHPARPGWHRRHQHGIKTPSSAQGLGRIERFAAVQASYLCRLVTEAGQEITRRVAAREAGVS